MNEYMVFLGVKGQMRKIIHLASRVGERLADVPDKDVEGHIEGH